MIVWKFSQPIFLLRLLPLSGVDALLDPIQIWRFTRIKQHRKVLAAGQGIRAQRVLLEIRLESGIEHLELPVVIDRR